MDISMETTDNLPENNLKHKTTQVLSFSFQFFLFITLIYLSTISLAELSSRIDIQRQIDNKINATEKKLSITAASASQITPITQMELENLTGNKASNDSQPELKLDFRELHNEVRSLLFSHNVLMTNLQTEWDIDKLKSSVASDGELESLIKEAEEQKHLIQYNKGIAIEYNTAITQFLDTLGVPTYEGNTYKGNEEIYRKLSYPSFISINDKTTSYVAAHLISLRQQVDRIASKPLRDRVYVTPQTNTNNSDNIGDGGKELNNIVPTFDTSQANEAILELQRRHQLLLQTKQSEIDSLYGNLTIAINFLTRLSSELNAIKFRANRDGDLLNVLNMCRDQIQSLVLSGQEGVPSSHVINRVVSTISTKNLNDEKNDYKSCRIEDLPSEGLTDSNISISGGWGDFTGITRFSSDSLLAMLLVCTGILGSLIVGIRRFVRNTKNKVDDKDEKKNKDKAGLILYRLVLGAAAGFILFLGIKGGAHILLSHIQNSFVSLNPYTSAFMGLFSGMFTEKVFDLLSEIADSTEKSLKSGA